MRFLPSITKIALVAVLLIIIGIWLAPYFAGTKQINPIAIELGQFQIHWYGLTMAAAILVSALISIYVALPRLKTITENQLLDAMVWMIAGGLIGARLLFVILKWPEYQSDIQSIWQIGEGGLSLHGAILGGGIGLLIYCWRYYGGVGRVGLKIADIAVVGIPLGQAIGRLGNFFNQEAFGGPTNLPWKMYVAPEFRPEGLSQFSFFHPTFAYEALLNLILFWFLLSMLKRYQFSGQLFLIYVAVYSLIRLFIEFFRIDSDYWGVLSIAQWASLVFVGCAILYYYRLINKEKRKVIIPRPVDN
jgi:phosphatidylglycerol:prolipoprotein diacylglycerol transferase